MQGQSREGVEQDKGRVVMGWANQALVGEGLQALARNGSNPLGPDPPAWIKVILLAQVQVDPLQLLGLTSGQENICPLTTKIPPVTKIPHNMAMYPMLALLHHLMGGYAGLGHV